MAGAGKSFIHITIHLRLVYARVGVVYMYTRFYVKILKQTYFVRVGQNGLAFRLQLSRCARAALPLSPFCILCVSKSFLHVCANPFNMAPTAGYLQQLLLHSLNTLANILALPVDCLLPSSSFLLPSSCLCLCLLQLLHLSIRRLIRLFNAFLRFCSTVGFCLLFIRSARGGGGASVVRGQTHLRITKRCFYMLNGKSNL